MSSSSSRSKKTSPSSSSSKEQQKLMTFRYNNSEVWVKLDTYQNAILAARSEFDELQYISSNRISFYVKFLDSGKFVRISESAWSSMLPKFAERSVIDIKLREERDIKAEDSPPGYFHLDLPEDKSAQQKPPVAHPSSSTSVTPGMTAGRPESLHDKLSKLIRR